MLCSTNLNEHEGNIGTDDDPSDVMATRFALLDAARTEVAMLIDETTINGPWVGEKRMALENVEPGARKKLPAANGRV